MTEDSQIYMLKNKTLEASIQTLISNLTLYLEEGIPPELCQFLPNDWTWRKAGDHFEVKLPAFYSWTGRVSQLAATFGYAGRTLVHNEGLDRIALYAWHEDGSAFKILFIATPTEDMPTLKSMRGARGVVRRAKKAE